MSKYLCPSSAALFLILATTSSLHAATDGWLQGHTGLWTEPTNWTLGAPPLSTDDVEFLGDGTTATYTVDSPTGVQLNSIYINSPKAAVYLNSPHIPLIDVEAGYVAIHGGLSNTTLMGFSRYTTVVGNITNSYISNVTLSGLLRILSAPVTGTLTFNNGELHLGNLLSGNVSDVAGTVAGNGSIQGTGTIVFDGPTIGQTISSYGFSTIPADITLTNGYGDMQLGNVTNSGSIIVTPGHYLIANSGFVNNGTLSLNQGTLLLNGWNTANSLGNVTNSGGRVVDNGALTVPGGTFDIDATFGAPLTLTGNVDASHITASGGSTLTLAPIINTYSGSPAPQLNVTFTAPNITFSEDVYVVPSSLQGAARFQGDLTLDNHTMTLGFGANVKVAGAILGTGNIVFNGYPSGGTSLVSVISTTASSLTIGSGVTIGTNPATPTLTAQIGLPNTGLLNQGTITSAAGTLSIYGNYWQNQGLLSITGGVLQLYGPVRTSDLGNISHTGGLLRFSGLFENANSTFTLTPAAGDWVASNATIHGGTIVSAGGSINLNSGLAPPSMPSPSRAISPPPDFSPSPSQTASLSQTQLSVSPPLSPVSATTPSAETEPSFSPKAPGPPPSSIPQSFPATAHSHSAPALPYAHKSTPQASASPTPQSTSSIKDPSPQAEPATQSLSSATSPTREPSLSPAAQTSQSERSSIPGRSPPTLPPSPSPAPSQTPATSPSEIPPSSSATTTPTKPSAISPTPAQPPSQEISPTSPRPSISPIPSSAQRPSTPAQPSTTSPSPLRTAPSSSLP
ncbi:MAG: hypothetical protein ACTHN5_04230 [Phycisphaerae bacterium]